MHARNLNSVLQVLENIEDTRTDNPTSNSLICTFNILVWVCTNCRLYDMYCYEHIHTVLFLNMKIFIGYQSYVSKLTCHSIVAFLLVLYFTSIPYSSSVAMMQTKARIFKLL